MDVSVGHQSAGDLLTSKGETLTAFGECYNVAALITNRLHARISPDDVDHVAISQIKTGITPGAFIFIGKKHCFCPR